MSTTYVFNEGCVVHTNYSAQCFACQEAKKKRERIEEMKQALREYDREKESHKGSFAAGFKQQDQGSL